MTAMTMTHIRAKGQRSPSSKVIVETVGETGGRADGGDYITCRVKAVGIMKKMNTRRSSLQLEAVLTTRRPGTTDRHVVFGIFTLNSSQLNNLAHAQNRL